MPDAHDPNLEPTHPTPVGEDPQVVAGRYRILRTLGRGGGGVVWLARDEHLGREVALKRIAGESDDEVLISRGLREARTSATLAHDHVVRLYDTFVHEGSPWIVMEHVPGPALSELLADGASLPVGQVARIGAQVAGALAAAHAAGVVHRDVKPGNVLLTDATGRHAKLTDFGIARGAEDHQLTATGMVSGTAAYFSPELARGEDPSPASDVWALGATLYAAVEGRRPFPEAANAVAQLHVIAREAPIEPSRAGLLEPVLAGMFDPDPAQRSTAAEVAQALSRIAQGHPEDVAAGAGTDWSVTQRPAGQQTEQVLRPDATRQIPTPPRQGRSATPAPTRGPAPSPARPPRRRRGNLVLGWLIGLPLAALLGWLVWTIASGGSFDLGGGTETTATAGQPVSVAEAEATTRAFYAALAEDGIPGARRHAVEGVPIHPSIAEGLDTVAVDDLRSRELGGGVVETTQRVTYSYGAGASTTVQDETLQVARRGTEALVVQRVTTLVNP